MRVRQEGFVKKDWAPNHLDRAEVNERVTSILLHTNDLTQLGVVSCNVVAYASKAEEEPRSIYPLFEYSKLPIRIGRRNARKSGCKEKIRIVALAGARAAKEFWCLVFDGS
jgi:hypothetical protein